MDTTAINPFDLAKARALLHQAGVQLPLELVMKLPPTPYARQGGEVIAAMLDKVGIKAIRHPIRVAEREGGVQHTIAMFNMYVALPHHFKGTHMSRFVAWLDDLAQTGTTLTSPLNLSHLYADGDAARLVSVPRTDDAGDSVTVTDNACRRNFPGEVSSGSVRIVLHSLAGSVASGWPST